jgi:hypothetical protein
VLGVDYPGVVPHSGKSVRGTLVQNLTLKDVDRLDAFEGDVLLILLGGQANRRNTKEET